MINKKTIKRILYGVIAVVFLAIAGRELLSVGMNLEVAVGSMVGRGGNALI